MAGPTAAVYKVFSNESSGEPDARYVLFRLLLDAKRQNRVDKVTDMARAFGMPEDRLRSALVRLQEGGYVLVHELRVSKTGRPRKRIALAESPELTQATSEIFGAPIYSSICKLADQKARRRIPKTRDASRLGSLEAARAQRASTRLSRSNALIVFLMLMSSDAYGVVEGLSTTSLAGLSGFTPSQLRPRLKRLMTLGVIRSCVPGGYSRLLKGRYASIYRLNLLHVALCGDTPAVSYAELGAVPELSVREMLRSARSHWVSRYLLSPGGAFYWALMAWPAESALACRVVQVLICNCASRALADGWHSTADRAVRVERIVHRLLAEHFDLSLSLGGERWSKLADQIDGSLPGVTPPVLGQTKQSDSDIYTISESPGVDGALYNLTLDLLGHLSEQGALEAVRPGFRVWLEGDNPPRVTGVQRGDT